MNYQDFSENIIKADDIIIFSHVNPDGDTLGSMTALYNVIKNNFQKIPTMVIAGELPEIYEFLPDIEKAVTFDKIEKDRVFDLAVAIDIAAKDRMGMGLPFFENAKVRMNIDHHKTNNGYGDYTLIKPDACSAGEILFDLFEEQGLQIDKNTADALYTSILTDTGGFRFENTSAKTFEIASKLVKYGTKPGTIARYCFESKPKAMVLLQANALINAEFLENQKIAYTCISQKDMEKFNAKEDYTEGIVGALRQIKTTEVAAVLKEVTKQSTKVSLRSKNVDCSKVAAAFDGGGHAFAAGCTIQKPLNIARDKLIEEIKKHI